VISPSQGRYLHRTTQARKKRGQTSLPRVGFELTTLIFERAKTVHVFDRAATVIGMKKFDTTKQTGKSYFHTELELETF
jgi:hypothetical protein